MTNTQTDVTAIALKATSHYHDVRGCARCGGSHAHLLFKPFALAPISDSDGALWTHWAACPALGPTFGEPILLQIRDVPDGPVKGVNAP